MSTHVRSPIKDNVENMKSEVNDSVKVNLNKLVDARTREI